MCEELGDLLFQIIFLARLAEERKEFDIIDIIEKISQKMIRRHPHVFGTSEVSGPEEVTENWQRIKESEKAKKNDSRSLSERLADIPIDLPSLLRAHRLCERASRGGGTPSHFDTDCEAQLSKDIKALEAQIDFNDTKNLEATIGELLFFLANLARKRGLNAEHLLRERNQTFIKQMGRLEKEGH